MSEFQEHAAHGPWEQIGPCVYCPCGQRLYQGRRPADTGGQYAMAGRLDEILAAAGKGDC